LLAIAALLAMHLTAMPSVAHAEYLVTNQAASQVGLEISWFAQVQVDPARHQVVHWLHDGDHLFALTSAGLIQSIDSETGATVWTNQVGVGHAPAAGLAVNDQYLALLGAGRIYIMDREDGHQMWSRPVGGAPTSAPALSTNYAYVALVSGRVEAYRLDDPATPVWQHDSIGRTFQSPNATGPVVTWATDRGLLYVGRADPPRVLFRVETQVEIVAAPAEQTPFLYVASLDGYLYCFHELTGSERWRYATGFAITSQPAIVEDTAFVASEGPTLHAVDSKTGQPKWRVDGVSQFAALGEQHTYGLNRYGEIIVLDSDSGAIAGRLRTGTGNRALVNDKSDRLYLVSDRGLVQCLHEIGANEPTLHRTTQKKDDSEAKDGAEQPGDGEIDGEMNDGVDAEAPAVEPETDPSQIPFGAEATEEPADEADDEIDEDNPFFN